MTYNLFWFVSVFLLMYQIHFSKSPDEERDTRPLSKGPAAGTRATALPPLHKASAKAKAAAAAPSPKPAVQRCGRRVPWHPGGGDPSHGPGEVPREGAKASAGREGAGRRGLIPPPASVSAALGFCTALGFHIRWLLVAPKGPRRRQTRVMRCFGIAPGLCPVPSTQANAFSATNHPGAATPPPSPFSPPGGRLGRDRRTLCGGGGQAPHPRRRTHR